MGSWWGVGLVVLAAMGCSGTPTGPGGVVTITGVTVTATPNPANLTVTVQATAAVQPSGASQSVTWATSAPAVATVNATGLVTLHLTGTVIITATSAVNPTHSGSVTLTVACPDPRLVTQPVAGPTTWENWIPDPSCYDYVVQRDVSTNDYDITIEPGTVVGFEQGWGMRVRQRGLLIAEGTEAEPIVLTGTTKTRGFWKGLALEVVDHGRSVLTWVTVEYTGGHNLGGRNEDSSLIMLGDAVARIQNSTFRESSGYGVSLDINSRIVEPEGNTFTANTLGAAWALAPAVPSLNGAVLTGNDVDEVVVQALTINDAVWPSATYRILEAGALAVDNGLLTLAPGSELRFEEGQQLIIKHQAGLNAVGTPSDPIVLTGTEPVRGLWGGLVFWGSSHVMNRLEHVTVEYGGGEAFGSASEAANVSLSLAGSGQNSSVAIVNSTLRASEEYGLWLHDKSGFTEFQGNTLTGNALGPAYVHLPSVDELTSGNDYSGNDTDEVVVEVGSGLQLTDPATWQDIGVPYYLMEKVGGAGIFAPLTIMPGVEILVEAGLGITVREAGTLTAVGTATDRITFRAKAGPWKASSSSAPLGRSTSSTSRTVGAAIGVDRVRPPT